MYNGVRMLADGEWPAMSPDLNPIEHLWPMVNRHMQDLIFSGKDDLYEALDTAFKLITPEQIQAISGNMARRLAAVIVANGAHTSY